MTAPMSPADQLARLEHCLRILGGERPKPRPRPISDEEQRRIDQDEARGEDRREQVYLEARAADDLHDRRMRRGWAA